MGALSNYAETQLLNSIFRSGTLYLALYKTNPTDSNTGEEVTGGNYARQSVTFGAPLQVNDKGTIRNATDVVFPVATADWGTVNYVGVVDAASGGNLIAYQAMTNPRAVLISDRLRWLAGEFSINVD